MTAIWVASVRALRLDGRKKAQVHVAEVTVKHLNAHE